MKRNSESGVALLSAILVLMLMSAMLVGFIALINADQNASGVNRDQTQSYAAAHAGVEKLTSDLGQLFETNFSPTGALVNGLVAPARQPNLGNGTSYVAPGGVAGSGYSIEFNDANGDGNPDPEDAVNGSQITDGVYAGLMGIITPYRMVVTARTVGGSEVRMRRTMQTVAIPVFQFGIFSDNDLSFFAGPDFNFGGRVHTNQNLYLAEGDTKTLTLSDRVTAVGDVIRQYLSNGQDLGTQINGGSTYNGTVRVAKASNCPSIVANCRDLAVAEDSVTLGAAPPLPSSVLTWNAGPPGRWEMIRRAGNVVSPGWDAISRAQYNSWVRNGETGARRLDLPIVDATAGTTPIDLIRRARPNEASGPGTSFQERFFRLASLRILISDTAADFNNIPTMTVDPPVDLSALQPGVTAGYNAPNVLPSRSDGSAGTLLANGVTTLRGFIKIERQRPDGVTWDDVTMNILNLGIAGRNLSTGVLNTPDTHTTQAGPVAPTNVCVNEPFPDAIIRLQRVRDVPTNGFPCGIVAGVPSTLATDYWPTVLYDAREATRRENDNPALLYAAGVMHYVELDVNNLRKWFNGTTGGGTGGGGNTMNTTGYVVYFSDRRNNKNALNAETGELGYEDIVNPGSPTSADNGALDVGEDFNGSGGLPETYGNAPRLAMAAPLNAGATLRTGLTVAQARMNPTPFFRRALKLVNGGVDTATGVSQLPAVGAQGLTVASENPLYVQGNYNACGTMEQSCVGTAPNYVDGYGIHESAAILADSVTLLSRNWNDIRSFTSPHAPGGRVAQETWYRMGVISGKGISFPRPTSAAAVDPKDFGTDGGAHNFMRFLENWGNIRLNYRGSLISLFTNRQGVGVYKCCNIVYGAPTRGYNFEVEFLTPNLLPPRTPMFRDVNTLTFRQVLRPTQ